ncbi:hypothetical protein B7P43_G04264, partial [Cryptotermes secundus]
SNTLTLLTVAYDEYAMKKSSAFEWHRRLKEGREDVQDDPRSGLPGMQRTDANLDRVRTTVLEHPPCSPYLASNDSFLFLMIKEILKGRHFDDTDDSRNDYDGSSEGHSTKPVPKLF